jgi:hypothetical protein
MAADSPDEVPPEEAPLGAGIDFTDPNSPLAPYYLRASHVVAAVLVGLLVFVYSLLPLWHTDVWGHLKFGKWMAEHHALPSTEPFSKFADKDIPYVNFQWLSQLGLYLTYHAGEGLAGGDDLRHTEGGVALLRSLTVVLALLYFLFLLRAYWRISDSLPLACAGLALYAISAPGSFAILRPQALAMVMFVSLLGTLSRKELTRRSLVLVPALLILWANLHGSFPLGLVLLGIFIAGRGFDVLREGRTWNPLRAFADGRVRRLTLILAVSTAAIAALNPHGPVLYWYVLRMGENPNVRMLGEWLPLWDLTEGLGVQSLYGLGAGVLAISWVLGQKRPSATQVLVLLAFGLWPIFQRRMLVWWMPLVPWLALPSWVALRDRLSWDWLRFESVLSLRKTIMVGLVVFMVLLFTPPVRWLVAGRPAPMAAAVTPATPWLLAEQLLSSPPEKDAPVPRLASELRHYPDGRFRGAIFASETQGDYLLWALPPEYPVVVYTHVHLFSERHWKEVVEVKNAGPRWRALLDGWKANLVVVEAETHPHLANALQNDREWIIVLDETRAEKPKPVGSKSLIALRKEPF